MRNVLIFILVSGWVFTGHLSLANDANPNCKRYLNQLIKSSRLTLQQLQKQASELDENSDRQKIITYAESIKIELATFFNNYTNTSDLKRPMVKNEIQRIRKNHGLTSLSDEQVQIFYSNELKRLLLLADKFLLEDIAAGFVASLDAEVHKKVILALYVFRGKDDIFDLDIELPQLYLPLLQLEERSWKALLNTIALIEQEEYEKALSKLEKSQFRARSLEIVNAMKRSENPDPCCKFGTGCVFCPYNRGLRYENKI